MLIRLICLFNLNFEKPQIEFLVREITPLD